MKQLFRFFIKILSILFLATCTGFLLLLIVYALPISPMKDNIARSSDIFNNQGLYPRLVPTYKTTQLDNVTDAMMLATAIYPAHSDHVNIVEQTMHGYRYELTDENALMSLTKYANDANDIKGVVLNSYERYWNGYLVYLKPLLCFFDYGDILLLNTLLLMCITAFFVYQLYKSNVLELVPAYIALLYVLTAPAIGLSLQYSSSFYIMQFALCYILSSKPKKILPYLFLITGICSAYFDLLTYPLITLGVPLALLIYLDLKSTPVQKIIIIIKESVLWSMGYLGMYLCKWTLASLLLHQNVYYDAISEMLNRTSNGTMDHVSRITSIMVNLSDIARWPYLIFTVIVIFVYFAKRNRNRSISIPNAICQSLPYFILCMYPLMWFALLSQHTYEHNYFTYRTLGISIFSFCLMICQLFNPVRRISDGETASAI